MSLQPLVIVNSAAILSCGLVAAGGAITGYLLRSLGQETIIPDLKKEETKAKSEKNSTTKPATSRGLLDENVGGVLQLFENFKLVYRNASGQRVGEPHLPYLSFLQQINCTTNPLQKLTCPVFWTPSSVGFLNRISICPFACSSRFAPSFTRLVEMCKLDRLPNWSSCWTALPVGLGCCHGWNNPPCVKPSQQVA